MPEEPLRLAAYFVRLARDPRSGRVPWNGPAAIGVRCGHLLQMVLSGHLQDQAGSPIPTATPDPLDDVLRTRWEAIRQRPGLTWYEWYWKQQADVARDLQLEERALVQAGVWQGATRRVFGVVPRRVFSDRSDDVSRDRRAIADDIARSCSREWVLALDGIAAVCGLSTEAVETVEQRIGETISPATARAVVGALDGAAATISLAKTGGGVATGPIAAPGT